MCWFASSLFPTELKGKQFTARLSLDHPVRSVAASLTIIRKHTNSHTHFSLTLCHAHKPIDSTLLSLALSVHSRSPTAVLHWQSEAAEEVRGRRLAPRSLSEPLPEQAAFPATVQELLGCSCCCGDHRLPTLRLYSGWDTSCRPWRQTLSERGMLELPVIRNPVDAHAPSSLSHSLSRSPLSPVRTARWREEEAGVYGQALAASGDGSLSLFLRRGEGPWGLKRQQWTSHSKCSQEYLFSLLLLVPLILLCEPCVNKSQACVGSPAGKG